MAHHGKINNLQVVRAVAALLVVYFHTGYYLPGLKLFGSFGVDIFFTLSGFIMASICARNTHAFFRRRLIRIVPAYWSCTLFMFGVALFFPSLVKTTDAHFDHLVKSLLFIPFKRADGTIQPTWLVGWTLNYEMYFYILLFIGLRLNRRYAISIAAGLIIAILIIGFPIRERSVLAAFYTRPIVLEFILGVVSHRAYSKMDGSRAARLAPLWVAALGVSMVVLIGLEGRGIDPDLFVKDDNFWFGVLSFFVILCASFLSKGGLDAKSGLLVLIGDASYVLYLTHPFVEIGLARVVGRRIPFLAPHGSLVGMIFALVMATFVALVLHVRLERPVVAALSRKFIREPVSAGKPVPIKDEVVA